MDDFEESGISVEAYLPMGQSTFRFQRGKYPTEGSVVCDDGECCSVEAVVPMVQGPHDSGRFLVDHGASSFSICESSAGVSDWVPVGSIALLQKGAESDVGGVGGQVVGLVRVRGPKDRGCSKGVTQVIEGSLVGGSPWEGGVLFATGIAFEGEERVCACGKAGDELIVVGKETQEAIQFFESCGCWKMAHGIDIGRGDGSSLLIYFVSEEDSGGVEEGAFVLAESKPVLTKPFEDGEKHVDVGLNIGCENQDVIHVADNIW